MPDLLSKPRHCDRIRAGIGSFLFIVTAFDVFGFFRCRSSRIDLGRILRLRDDIRCIGVDETDDDVGKAPAAILHRLIGPENEVVGWRIQRDLSAHGIETFFDALGDTDFTFASEQFDGAHFTHVHAHGICGATKLCIERSQRCRGFFDGFFVGWRSGLRGEQ